jgi:hypothetical protein
LLGNCLLSNNRSLARARAASVAEAEARKANEVAGIDDAVCLATASYESNNHSLARARRKANEVAALGVDVAFCLATASYLIIVH